jgi:sortase A
LLLFAAIHLGQGLWIYLKAELAQVLIAQAWSRPGDSKPWPWADTWPVARLQLPEKNVDLFVLDGDQGNALAFGPGHLRESALPGASGMTVIAGHRDTHFSFLADLKGDEYLRLTDKAGVHRDYLVSQLRIADIREGPLLASGEGVMLVTCYPFDAIDPGGPLRFVVLAKPLAKNL